MYIHLGRNTVVKHSSIIGIFDLESTSVSKITRGFLSSMEKKGRVVNVSTELPASYVLCCERGVNTLYISQISTATLLKRAKEKLI